MKTPEQRIQEALKIAHQYAGCDGSHHKMWTIDQMVNVLNGGEEGLDSLEHLKWIEAYEDDGKYEWDRGIAP